MVEAGRERKKVNCEKFPSLKLRKNFFMHESSISYPVHWRTRSSKALASLFDKVWENKITQNVVKLFIKFIYQNVKSVRMFE